MFPSSVRVLLICLLALVHPGLAVAERVIDGFNVYCTSNMDGTGFCTNMETNGSLDCIIIPGQVIDCKSASGRSFQCVIYSQITPNQAEFFCDPSAERLLLQDGDLNNETFSDPLKNVL